MTEPQAFLEWFERGVAAGWISAPFCNAHDGPPLTDEERALADDEWDLDDNCVHCVRLLV